MPITHSGQLAGNLTAAPLRRYGVQTLQSFAHVRLLLGLRNARRPIKAVYIKRFLALIDQIED